MARLLPLLSVTFRFYTFPDYIEKTTFGVSCDAFANFKETLIKHKPMVAEYLEKNYDRFFTMYDGLLQSPNYVTKRQSLKLLGEILLDRANFNVMTRYIGHEANLKMMMNLLRDKSKNIQFEAFHVFKVSSVCCASSGTKYSLPLRSSWPTPRNQLKSKPSSEEIRTNFWYSSRISTTIKKVS